MTLVTEMMPDFDDLSVDETEGPRLLLFDGDKD
jgi:hypothetical protein